MGKVYSDKEIEEMVSSIPDGYPVVRFLMEKYDISEGQAAGVWKKAKKLGLAIPRMRAVATDLTGKELSPTILHLQSFIRKQKEIIARERSRNSIIIEAIYDAVSKSLSSPLRIKYPKLKRRKSSHSDMILLRSDAHVGEETTPESTQGLVNYNFEEYKKRLTVWTNKVLSFWEDDKSSHGLQRCIILHLGDQVTGENIFPGQSFSIDLPAVDQIFESAKLEAETLMLLASRFETVDVYCVVGNHGRPGKKGSNHPKTNWDYIFYKYLSILFQNVKNVNFFISPGKSMLFKLGDFNNLIGHGDDINSHYGIPYYGLSRKVQRLDNLYNMRVHHVFLGHFHTPFSSADEAFINGAFTGGSDLSVNKMGVISRPSQKLLYYHYKEGVHRNSNLYLAPQVVLTPDKQGIYTPREK